MQCSVLINLQQRLNQAWSWAKFGITVKDEANKYQGNVTKLGGNTTYDLSAQNNMKFSTLDQDNLLILQGNCAVIKDAGWWYGSPGGPCSLTNLNAHGND